MITAAELAVVMTDELGSFLTSVMSILEWKFDCDCFENRSNGGGKDWSESKSESKLGLELAVDLVKLIGFDNCEGLRAAWRLSFEVLKSSSESLSRLIISLASTWRKATVYVLNNILSRKYTFRLPPSFGVTGLSRTHFLTVSDDVVLVDDLSTDIDDSSRSISKANACSSGGKDLYSWAIWACISSFEVILSMNKPRLLMIR